jgi:uncharacterized Zn finger protein
MKSAYELYLQEVRETVGGFVYLGVTRAELCSSLETALAGKSNQDDLAGLAAESIMAITQATMVERPSPEETDSVVEVIVSATASAYEAAMTQFDDVPTAKAAADSVWKKAVEKWVLERRQES